MSHSNSVMFLPEGASANRPPGFTGEHYYYWKDQMRLFLESQDTDLWGIVENGPYEPESTLDDGTTLPKPRNTWTPEDKRMVLLNSKAKFYLTCALGRSEYDKVAGKQTAKEIWDTLRTAHEGTDQVKEAKINLLIHKFETFKMEEHETVAEMFSRFTTITNDLDSLGNTCTNQTKVRKLLRCLPKVWRPKVTAITEAKDLSTLKIEDLLGSLKVHEQEIMDELHPKKVKTIALKASQKSPQSSKALKAQEDSQEESEGDEDDTDDEEEMALITRRLRRWAFRKNNNRKPFFKKDQTKGEGSSKTTPVCYECNKPGHFKNECPKLKGSNKKFTPKKKALLATWDESDETESGNEEDAAHFCLMVNSEEPSPNSPTSSMESINSCFMGDADQGEVSTPKLVCASCKEFEHAFENLLADSNTLIQKCSMYKEQHFKSKDEYEELKKKYEHALKTNNMLRYRITRISEEQVLNNEKSEIAIANLEEQNNLLKDNILAMIEERDITTLQLSKDSKEKPTRQSSKEVSKNKRPRVKCTYCKKFGHDISVCFKRKKGIIYAKKSNHKGPNNQWVPKGLLTFETGMPSSIQEKTVVPGQWMLQAHDRREG